MPVRFTNKGDTDAVKYNFFKMTMGPQSFNWDSTDRWSTDEDLRQSEWKSSRNSSVRSVGVHVGVSAQLKQHERKMSETNKQPPPRLALAPPLLAVPSTYPAPAPAAPAAGALLEA